ncbi:MAG: S8 family serine peptidase [Candidatus Brocadia sp.]|nr:S8 family serine peptidase [Candidatus Brocadia sp.]
MDPRLQEFIEEGEGAEEVEVILKLRQGDITPPHVRIITQFGDIATCRLRRDQIHGVWEHPATVSVKGPRYVAPEPEFVDESEVSDTGTFPSDSRRPDSLEVTGQGAVIGIVDWGFAFLHPNFRKSDGSTRLLALWDQGNTTALEKPAPYGYGVVYSPDEINRALQSPQPYETLGYHPGDSDPLGYGTHGTHVCDIAAGNGRAEGSPVGIAPEANIVFVHLAARGTGGLANLGDSVRILEALDFIARVAGERPWVVNLSLGRCGGPHTGLTLVEQGMDALLLQAPGRAICMSTGNYFDELVHAAGQLHPGQKHTVTWWTNKADVTPNELECWYSGNDSFIVEVRPPESNAVFHVPLGEQRSIQVGGQEVGHIYHRARDPGKGDNHIDIFLYPVAPAGSWLVTLIGEDIVDGRFHCWVERDNTCPQCQSRFDPQDAVPTSTIGTICNGFRTIAVGAYNHHSPGLEVAIFSSSGPTADGRQKPDLIAPGVRILAARSSSRDQHIGAPVLTRKSGTSMASPHVTGTIACMFEAAQRPLWIHEARKILLSTCKTITAPPEIAARVGNGCLDIKKAVEAARIFAQEEIHPVSKMTPIGGEKAKDVVMNRNDEYSREEELEDTFFNEEEEGDDEGSEEAPKKRNFILISGGPGLFDDRDVEHDKSWANYVTPPLLMTDTEDKRKKFAQDDEEVWWFVYKPAYDSRWDDDLKQKRKSTREVKDKGFASYVDMVEGRAKERGWNLRWLDTADDLWKKLKTFSKDSLSRVWYWGHARDDLWLSLGHSSASVAVAPESHEIILVTSIDSNKKLQDRFQNGDTKRIHRFVGCNTSAFAQAWSKTFKVWSEGVEEKVDFSAIHKTGGEPSLVGSAKIKFFSPKGIEADPTEAWQPEVAAAEDSWTEASDDESFEDDTVEVLRAEKFVAEENNEETDAYEICESEDDEEQDDEVFPEVEKDFGVELVGLADESISAGKAVLSGGALLHETLSKSGIAETVSPLGAGSFPSPASIFDAFAYGGIPALQRHYEQFFEVVALPGSRLSEPLQRGDVIVRRALGEGRLAHVAIVATPELWSQNQLMEGGLYGESERPGFYVQVVEGGSRPHTLADSFARRVLDSRGRLYPDSVILRVVRRPQGIPIIEGEDTGYSENLQAYTASRFQGDAILIEVLNNRRELKKGSKGGAVGVAVRKVQEALLDLGYTLPKFGADGNFGRETKAAVQAFQKDQKKVVPSLKVDGIVGDETMTRFDVVFALLDRPCGASTAGAIDPTAGGGFQPGNSNYTSGTISAFGDTLEVRGNIFYPAAVAGSGVPFALTAGGASPIVFIAHGNHARFHDPAERRRERGNNPGGWTRIGNHRGYVYLQEALARLGIISVSVDCHDLNGPTPMSNINIAQRAMLIIAAMRHFQALNTPGSGSIFEGRIDFLRVGLLGHSRGAESVLFVPSITSSGVASLLQGLQGVTFRGVISLAPTDTATVTSAPAGIPFMAILPAADGDVRDNDGAKFYDQTAPSPFKVQLYIHRANHNFFNTEWVNSEWQRPWPSVGGPPPAQPEPPLMTEAEHRRILSVYATAFFRHTLLGTPFIEVLTGRETPPGVNNADIQISAEISTATTVDDYENSNIRINTLGQATVDAGTLTSREVAFSQPGAGPDTTYFGNTHGMVAQSPTAMGTFREPFIGEINLAGREVWLRAAEVYHGTPIPADATGFQIGLEDAAGIVTFVPSGDLPRPFDRETADLAQFGVNLTKTMLKTVRFPANCFTHARPSLDLTRIRAAIIRLNRPDARDFAFDQLQIVTV